MKQRVREGPVGESVPVLYFEMHESPTLSLVAGAAAFCLRLQPQFHWSKRWTNPIRVSLIIGFLRGRELKKRYNIELAQEDDRAHVLL
jgi:hypothetical protein